MSRFHLPLAVFTLLSFRSIARADGGLAPAALVDKMPFHFVIDEHAAPSPAIDTPDAVARRAVTLTAKQERGAPLVFHVTLITYPSEKAATLQRQVLEDPVTRPSRDRSMSLLTKEWQLVFQKGATLVQASASCSISEPFVRTFQQRLIQQLGPLPMGPLRCSCGGACVVEK